MKKEQADNLVEALLQEATENLKKETTGSTQFNVEKNALLIDSAIKLDEQSGRYPEKQKNPPKELKAMGGKEFFKKQS